MIHATYGALPQHFSMTHRNSVGWTKDVINTPVVDGGLPRIATQIMKILQKIDIGFTVVLRIVGEKIGLVSDADFEIEISRDKDNLAPRLTTGPVNDFGSKPAAT